MKGATVSVLPRKQISILTGASGAGKTTLLLQALQAHIRGKAEFPMMFGDAKHIGIVIADRTSTETLERLEHLGIAKDIQLYGIADDRELNLKLLENPDLLFKACVGQFNPQPDVLVLDPIMLFMDGSSLDYKLVAKSLIRMARWCVDNNATIVATHHSAKARSDFAFLRPQDRISGSAAFQGYSGTQMVLIEGKEKGEDHDRLVLVPHLSPMEDYKLMRRDDGYFSVVDPRSLFEKVVEALKSKFVEPSEVHSQAALAGLTNEQIRGFMEEMFVPGPKGHIQRR